MLPVAAYDWPVWPDSNIYPLGNSYGQFQCYGGSSCFPFVHSGIDIMVPPGTPVYAIKAGYIKAIITTSAEIHWRVVVGDSAGLDTCFAFMYAHLSESSIIDTDLQVGDWVEEGDLLGSTVYFIDIFHHIHFSKIRYWGNPWNWATNWHDWEFAGNPLDELDNIYDPDPPVFENAIGNQLLAFCENETSNYFTEGEALSGNVDIICRVYDYKNHYDWKLTPYQVVYMITGDSSIPWTNAICFTGNIGAYPEISDEVYIYYKNDNTCQTYGDYDNRQYNFILTNSDGDSTIEFSDAPLSLETTNFHNGEYTIYVRAHDRYGNTTDTSMVVTLGNYFTLSGNIIPTDSGNGLSGFNIDITPDEQFDTTDTNGDFEFPLVGGGSQHIEIYKWGFEPFDTILVFTQNHELNIVLQKVDCCANRGNADNIIGTGGPIDVSDLVYLVDYLLKGGPTPWCESEGNADAVINNGLAIDIADLTYLVDYLFKGGPAPPEC